MTNPPNEIQVEQARKILEVELIDQNAYCKEERDKLMEMCLTEAMFAKAMYQAWLELEEKKDESGTT